MFKSPNNVTPIAYTAIARKILHSLRRTRRLKIVTPAAATKISNPIGDLQTSATGKKYHRAPR